MRLVNENVLDNVLKVGLLGPLEAELCGASVVPTAGKPRQILALLALNANQVLPASTLMREIWGADAPRSALTTLQTYILQIRRLLSAALGRDAGAAAKEVLATRHGGYLLDVPAGRVDVVGYRNLLASARAHRSGGDCRAAARAYDEALAQWRGDALVDVRCGPVLELELARLEENRLAAVEERNDTWLRLGHHGELLSELTMLVGQNPFNERLHAQCMTALYRAGRQNRALEVFGRLRRRLIDELGVEPSREVRSLHEAILTADPVLDLGRADERPASALAHAG